MHYRRLLLAMPAGLLTVADMAITLWGQPAAYWSDYARFNEANPASGWLLSHGPWVYLCGKIVYLAVLAGAVVLLPRIFALLGAASFTLGHAFGIMTWLLYEFQASFAWLYLFFPAVTAVILWQAWYYFFQIAPAEESL